MRNDKEIALYLAILCQLFSGGSCWFAPLALNGRQTALRTEGLVRVIDWMPEACHGRGVTAMVFDRYGELVLEHTAEATGDAPAWSPNVQEGVGSVSKLPATATFMAAVIDTSKGSLDTTLSEVLPEIFGAEGAYGGNVTVRMILSHTGGFNDEVYRGHTDCFIRSPYHVNHCRAADVAPTLQSCLAQVSRMKLQTQPGENFVYSNNGFLILAAITERLTGLTFEAALQRYIAEPLGMNATTYECPDSGSTVELPFVSNGLCTTASDFSKLVQAVLLSGVSSDGVRVLSEASVTEMTSVQTGRAVKTRSEWFKARHESPDGKYNSLIPTDCFGEVTNSEPPFQDSLLDYGLGTFLLTGFKFRAFMHPGSQGWIWYVVPGQYAALFAISSLGNNTMNAQTYWYFAAALRMLEDDSFPFRDFCEQDPAFRDVGFLNVGARFMYVHPPQCAARPEAAYIFPTWDWGYQRRQTVCQPEDVEASLREPTKATARQLLLQPFPPDANVRRVKMARQLVLVLLPAAGLCIVLLAIMRQG